MKFLHWASIQKSPPLFGSGFVQVRPYNCCVFCLLGQIFLEMQLSGLTNKRIGVLSGDSDHK